MKRLWEYLLSRLPMLGAGGGVQPLSAYSLEVGSICDIGLTRSNNQDHIGNFRFADNRNILAVVADGMGGHQGGEIASLTAIETFQRKFADEAVKRDYPQALVKGFAEANSAVYRLSMQSNDLQGMGTTLVALAIVDGYAYYANTGDSRLYLLRGGALRQLSQDHTMVAEMVKGGLLSPAAAECHPDRNVITSAIGSKSTYKIAVSEKPLVIEAGDYFLLCSDGLYDPVSEGEISRIIRDHSVQAACNRLVELANQRGGYDNISAIVIKITENSLSNRVVPITRA